MKMFQFLMQRVDLILSICLALAKYAKLIHFRATAEKGKNVNPLKWRP